MMKDMRNKKSYIETLWLVETKSDFISYYFSSWTLIGFPAYVVIGIKKKMDGTVYKALLLEITGVFLLSKGFNTN